MNGFRFICPREWGRETGSKKGALRLDLRVGRCHRWQGWGTLYLLTPERKGSFFFPRAEFLSQ
eukprot:4817217-Pyramimonas_sp.AAC.1